MKPLHLLAGKDPLRPHFTHIVVKNQFVYVSNGNALIKLPVKEVFPGLEFTDDEVLCFDAVLWATLKFHTSKLIVREGNVFKNLTNGTEMKAKTPKEADFKVPDYDGVLPEANKPVVQTSYISFNVELLATIAKALGTKKPDLFTLQFYGVDRCIEVLHNDFTGARIIIMPCTTMNEVKPAKEAVKPVEEVVKDYKPVEAPEKKAVKAAVKKVAVYRVVDEVLDMLDKHQTDITAILDDYVVGDEEARSALASAAEYLRENVADIEVNADFDKLVEAVVEHDDFDAEELLKAVDKEHGAYNLHEYVSGQGYGLIKVENIDQQSKLREFVESQIWPLHADRDNFSI